MERICSIDRRRGVLRWAVAAAVRALFRSLFETCAECNFAVENLGTSQRKTTQKTASFKSSTRVFHHLTLLQSFPWLLKKSKLLPLLERQLYFYCLSSFSTKMWIRIGHLEFYVNAAGNVFSGFFGPILMGDNVTMNQHVSPFALFIA